MPTSAPTILTLGVATLNVWGGVPFIGRHDLPRMRAIGDALGEMALDLVGFQEAWTAPVRSILIEGARRAGLVHAWAPARGGGLLIASRHPVRDGAFLPYALGGLPHQPHRGDYWAGKGLAVVTVSAEGRDVHFVNTHLVAQYGNPGMDTHRLHRIAQVVQLAAALRRLRGPLILVGDLNMEDRDIDYRILGGLTGLRDAAVDLDRREATMLPENPYRLRHAPARLDYVLSRHGRGSSARARSLERTFDRPLMVVGRPGAYSDHAGLRAEIDLTPSADAEPPPPDPKALALARLCLERAEAEASRRQARRRIESTASLAGALAAGYLARSAARRSLSRRGFAGLALLASGASLAAALTGRTYGREETAGVASVSADLDRLARLTDV